MECIKRNVGHLCTKDERQPRAKRAKTGHSADKTWVLHLRRYNAQQTCHQLLSVLLGILGKVKTQRLKRLYKHSSNLSMERLTSMPLPPPASNQPYLLYCQIWTYHAGRPSTSRTFWMISTHYIKRLLTSFLVLTWFIIYMKYLSLAAKVLSETLFIHQHSCYKRNICVAVWKTDLRIKD